MPIIPEYLLRLSHPNSTDLLLYNKAPIQQNRGKRETDDYNEPMVWSDNAWEVPFDGGETKINWEESPLNPIKYTTRKSKTHKGINFSLLYNLVRC